MSGEFFNLAPVSPRASDELLLIRDRTGKRATVANLLEQSPATNGLIAFSETPPTDKPLWWQMAGGVPVEMWQRRPGDIWVSNRTWSIDAFVYELKRNYSWPLANPCPGMSIWIEDFTARSWVWDEIRNSDYIDFELKTVNTQQQKIPLYYLRLNNASRGDIFNVTEPVNQLVSFNDAIGLWLSITRRGSRKVKTASLAATLRKVYAPGNG